MLTPSQSSTWYGNGARNKNYKMPRRKLLALTTFLLFVKTCERVFEDGPAMKRAQHQDQIQSYTSRAMSCPDSNLTILAPICKMRWHDMYFSYSFNLSSCRFRSLWMLSLHMVTTSCNLFRPGVLFLPHSHLSPTCLLEFLPNTLFKVEPLRLRFSPCL